MDNYRSGEKVGIIFDTETTGLVKPRANDLDKQPHIIELYALKFDLETLEPLGDLDILIKPPAEITREITKITGITNEMIAKAPSFRKLYGKIADFFLGVHRMVAHNLSFDRSMLLYELARIDKQLNFPWPMQHVCTVEKSIQIQQRRLKLQALHEELLGEKFEDAHRAQNDVEALFRCYQVMVKKGMIL